jgi:alkylation response protein AidB-like acyl-CoA dehydrogenase
VAASTIGDQTPEIIEDCVQMHGGIGVTWEHDIHLYLRRVTLNRALYGAPDEHRERLAVLLGL